MRKVYKSDGVAGKPRDAIVNFDSYVSNTINSKYTYIALRYVAYVTLLAYLLINFFFSIYNLITYIQDRPAEVRPTYIFCW